MVLQSMPSSQRLPFAVLQFSTGVDDSIASPCRPRLFTIDPRNAWSGVAEYHPFCCCFVCITCQRCTALFHKIMCSADATAFDVVCMNLPRTNSKSSPRHTVSYWFPGFPGGHPGAPWAPWGPFSEGWRRLEKWRMLEKVRQM